MRSSAVTLLALAILAGCAISEPSTKHTAPILLGAVLPFSGGVELYGRQAQVGLNLAASEINAAGGILGHPVEIIYRDDGTRPGPADKAVRELIERDHVFAVIGPITSRNLEVLKPISEMHKTPLLYATNYEGVMCGRYFFSFNTVPNQELGQLLPYMNETFGNSYYLLGADRVWPHKMFEVAEPLIAKLGGKVVGKAYTLGTETDFALLIERIAASKADVLLFALKGDGLNFINQARELGLMNQVTIAFLGMSEIELPIFQGKAQGMFVTVPFLASDNSPAVKNFVSRVKAHAGEHTTVSQYVMAHYNALMAMKAAIEKAGKVDRQAMITALEGLTIESPTGPLTVGKHHHSTMNLYLAKSAGLQLATVRPLGPVAPEPVCK